MLGLWWTLIPTILGMLVLTTLPAFFFFRILIRSSAIAFAAAPAVVFGVLAALSVVFDSFGFEWERAKVFPVFGLFTLLGALWWLLTALKKASGGVMPSRGMVAAMSPRRPLSKEHATIRFSTWGMIFLGCILAAAPMLMRADPRLPPQQWDSTFHLNGVWSILRTHGATPFGGLAELYDGKEVFYPTLWHALTALFATPTHVVQVANASSIVLMIIWVSGATALTSLLTQSRAAILASPVLAGLLLNMPADNLTMYNQWPNATGLAVIPGLLAAAIVLGRRIVSDVDAGFAALAHHIPLSILILTGVVGATAAHPTSAFVLAALAIPAFLSGAWKIAKEALEAHAIHRALIIGVLTAAVTAAPFLALTADKIRDMGEYPRSGISWSYALSHMFTPSPPFASTRFMTIYIAVQMTLLICGVVSIWISRKTEDPLPLWPMSAYLVFSMLTFLAYAPLGDVRTWLLAPWYMDARRIMGAHGLAMVPLMGLGFNAIGTVVTSWLPQRVKRGAHEAEHVSVIPPARWKVDVALGLVLLLITGVGAYDARGAATDYVYTPEKLGKPGMASRQELAMIRRMQLLLPADAVVLGDPIAGAAYTQVIGQHDAVFPQLSRIHEKDSPEHFLANSFNTIHEDPAVCEAVNTLGITHYYEDVDDWYYDFLRSKRYPGLYHVDTSRGFDLIDEGGTAKLWKITACTPEGD